MQGPIYAPHSGVVAGYPQFVRARVLQQHAHRYLVNDTLVIR